MSLALATFKSSYTPSQLRVPRQPFPCCPFPLCPSLPLFHNSGVAPCFESTQQQQGLASKSQQCSRDSNSGSGPSRRSTAPPRPVCPFPLCPPCPCWYALISVIGIEAIGLVIHDQSACWAQTLTRMLFRDVGASRHHSVTQSNSLQVF